MPDNGIPNTAPAYEPANTQNHTLLGPKLGLNIHPQFSNLPIKIYMYNTVDIEDLTRSLTFY